jgi:WD40-like Beta Propeller Repeat
MRPVLLALTALLFISQGAITAAAAVCTGGATQTSIAVCRPLPPVFANAEAVTINGYSGPSEDPVVSPDGTVLFFDSFNDGGLPSNLYWATRTTYKSVQYVGAVGNVNTFSGPPQTTLRGNYDLNNNFYFAYANSPSQPAGVHIAHGTWNNGNVTSLTNVTGISTSTNLTFDVYISPDGNTLLSDFVTFGGGGASSSVIFGATPSGAALSELTDSGAVFATVNLIPGKPVVYNSALTPDGLSLFVTASPPQPSVTVPMTYMVSRNSPSAPFGAPTLVNAVNNPGSACPGQFYEVGGMSPDGKYLYFHSYQSTTTSMLCVVTRQ